MNLKSCIVCAATSVLKCRLCTCKDMLRDGEPDQNFCMFFSEKLTRLRAPLIFNLFVSVTSGLWFDPGGGGVCIEVLL